MFSGEVSEWELHLIKVVVFWLGYLAVLFVATKAMPLLRASWSQLFWGALSAIAVLALTGLFLRREGRTWESVGLGREAWRPRMLLAGAVLAVVAYALTLLVTALISGPMGITAGSAAPRTLVLMTATFAVLAVVEETGFRGYPLRALAERLGTLPAQLIVAAVFAGTHLLFGLSWQVSVSIVPFAILYGVVAIASGGLAMPIALHATLNIIQWAIGEGGGPGIWDLTYQRRNFLLLTAAEVAVPLILAAVIARFPAALLSGRNVRDPGR